MSESPIYYQPPASEEHAVRNMIWGLTLFFGALVGCLLLLIINAHHLAAYLPFSVEKQFVRPYEEMANRWYTGKTFSQAETYLNQLALQLASPLQLDPTIQVQIHVIDSPNQNAFATLGGHIFVFKGLIDSVSTENALVMVLAHEMAHVKHRHPIVSLGRGMALQMMYSFVSGQTTTLADFGGQLGMLFFSREQEMQADLDAIQALQQHYGHIAGFDDFFAAMAQHLQDDEKDMPEWLTTHPDLNHRIAYLEQYAQQQGWSKGEPMALPAEVLSEIAQLSSN